MMRASLSKVSSLGEVKPPAAPLLSPIVSLTRLAVKR